MNVLLIVDDDIELLVKWYVELNALHCSHAVYVEVH